MLRRVPNVIVALPVKRAHALKTHWAFWPKWIEKSRSRVPLPLPVKRAHALKTHGHFGQNGLRRAAAEFRYKC